MVPQVAPWLMLVSRFCLFAVFQALFALIFMAAGSQNPWHTSEAWWPFSVLLANIICIGLIAALLHKEGTGYFKVFLFIKDGWWKDLLISVGLLALAGPISMLPNVWLARALFGSSEAAFQLFFKPLPQWAIVVAMLFPITHIFAELPTYFGYAMPRIAKQLNNGWAAWGIASIFLALQHAALPLVPDARFICWRIEMFLPLALFIGLCIKLRPRLLPYVIIGHGLMDLMLVLMIPVVKP
jgi:hypothetical protein